VRGGEKIFPLFRAIKRLLRNRGKFFCRLSGLPLQAPALRVARDSSPRDCRPSVFSASLGAPLQRIILVTNGRPIGSAYVVEMSAAAFIAGRANGFAFFLVS